MGHEESLRRVYEYLVDKAVSKPAKALSGSDKHGDAKKEKNKKDKDHVKKSAAEKSSQTAPRERIEHPW
jgi:hypothetical protein